MSKILVVDDVGYVRHSVTNMLKKCGYASVSAESGVEALEILRKDALISVVLTDGPMPAFSGFDLLRACQKLERHHDQGQHGAPKVVLMVTPDMSGARNNHPYFRADCAESYGFAGVLTKPITEATLKKCLRAFEDMTPPVAQPATPATRAIAVPRGAEAPTVSSTHPTSKCSWWSQIASPVMPPPPACSVPVTASTQTAVPELTSPDPDSTQATAPGPAAPDPATVLAASTLRAIKDLVDNHLKELAEIPAR